MAEISLGFKVMISSAFSLYVRHLPKIICCYRESRDYPSMKKFAQLALYHYVFSQIFDD